MNTGTKGKEQISRRVIWTSSLDLSPAGIEAFCSEAAARYGKSEQDLKAMSPMDIAITYMWAERRRKKQLIMEQLSEPTALPILVILQRDEHIGTHHTVCSVLSGERLSQIFSCPQDGLSVTFYADSKDVRCISLTDNGAEHYLFREITNMDGFSSLIQRIERGEEFWEALLSRNTKSLLPQVSALLHWDTLKHLPIQYQLDQAQEK